MLSSRGDTSIERMREERARKRADADKARRDKIFADERYWKRFLACNPFDKTKKKSDFLVLPTDEEIKARKRRIRKEHKLDVTKGIFRASVARGGARPMYGPKMGKERRPYVYLFFHQTFSFDTGFFLFFAGGKPRALKMFP